ncbi:MAG: GAF domain-containing protein [Chloroflexota bacterium]|nr:GAF domain-containing protein [Chloroflexota bacterium]
MKENETPKHQPTQNQVRNALYISAGMLVVQMIVSITILSTVGMPTTLLDPAVLIGVNVFAAGVSLWLNRTGRSVLGIQIMLGVQFSSVVLMSLQVQGTGLPMAAFVVVLTFGITSATLPRKMIGWFNGAAGAIALFIIILDIFEPFERPGSSETTSVSWIIAGTLVLILGILILRQFRSYALRTKIIIAMMLLSIVGIGMMTAFSVKRTQAALLEDSFDKLSAIETIKLNQIQNWIATRKSEAIFARTMSVVKGSQGVDVGLPTFVQFKNDPSNPAYQAAVKRGNKVFNAYIENIANGIYENIMLTDLDGDVVYSLNPEFLGDNESHSPEFQNGLHALYFGDMYYNPDRQHIELRLAIPVLDAEKKNIGVLIFELDPQVITNIMSERTGLGETGETYIVGQDNLFRNDSRFLDELDIETTTLNPNTPVDTAATRNALVGGSGSQIIDSYRGRSVLSAWSPILVQEPTALDPDGITWALVAEIDATEVLAPAQAQTRAIMGMAILVIGTAAAAAFGLTQAVTRPIIRLTAIANQFASGNFSTRAQIVTADEVGDLTATFNKMATQLSDTLTTLEQRVADRTHDLQQRSAYLEGSADISRAAASILESDALIRQVVELIKDRFELYYVGLFLVDERNEWAVLQAGTGEPGRKMLARNHRLKIGEGMIGWSIANAESRIALDVGEDAVRFENPDLPETRSEGALPLRSRGRVLGALTVQCYKEAAFDQDIITTLQTMADQIAVALDNAELLAKSEAALKAERRAYGELSHAAWVALSQSQAVPGYLMTTEGAMHPIKGPQPSETTPVIQNKPVIQNDGLTAIIPIKCRGRILGGIKIRKDNDSDTWTQAEVELAETLSEQLSVALESARLHQDTQRRAAREQLTSEITTHLRETLDIETVLETAAIEMREALGLDEAEVWISAASPTEQTGSGDGQEQSL